MGIVNDLWGNVPFLAGKLIISTKRGTAARDTIFH